MSQTTNAPLTFPSSVADAADSPVADVLTDVLRRGARAMLVQAVEAGGDLPPIHVPAVMRVG